MTTAAEQERQEKERVAKIVGTAPMRVQRKVTIKGFFAEDVNFENPFEQVLEMTAPVEAKDADLMAKGRELLIQTGGMYKDLDDGGVRWYPVMSFRCFQFSVSAIASGIALK